MLSERTAANLRSTGVRVNSLLPGVFDAEANRRTMSGPDDPKWSKSDASAAAILFLCSETRNRSTEPLCPSMEASEQVRSGRFRRRPFAGALKDHDS